MGAGSLSFKSRVYVLTTQIPAGKVSTYGAIARALGQPRATRAVGNVLRLNPTPIVVPCHRVVHADGRLGGYGGAGGAPKKAALLKAEGLPVGDGQIPDLPRHFFADFR